MGRFTNALQGIKDKKKRAKPPVAVQEGTSGYGKDTQPSLMAPPTPMEAGTAKTVLVLPKTTIPKSDDQTLWEEQMVAKTEVAMLKGYRDPRMMAQLLQITVPQAEKFIKRVLARFEIVGTAHDLKRVRGEGLARMAMLERKYWQIIETSKDQRAKIVALQSLLEINKQRDLYNGVSQKTMESVSQRTEGSEVQARLAKQARLGAMAKQLAEIIAEQQRDATAEKVTVVPADQSIPQDFEEEDDGFQDAD